MDEAKLLAAKIIDLGAGQDKALFMEALLWSVAASIWHAYPEDGHADAVVEFADRIAPAVAAIKRGQLRRPS